LGFGSLHLDLVLSIYRDGHVSLVLRISALLPRCLNLQNVHAPGYCSPYHY
jgi:hypothetical protein